MATLQDHARLALFIDTTYQVTMTSIEMATNSGQQRVDTLEGLAGFTPGSGDVTFTCGFSIPIGGQEFPIQQAVDAGTYHTVQMPLGPEDYVGLGKFIDCNITQSVNANTEGTFTWVGQKAPLE